MKRAHVSIRQLLLLTALVGIGITVGIPIYNHYFPKQVSLPTPYYLFDEYPDDALKQIRFDLALSEDEVNVLELTKTNLMEQGVREEALIQSRDRGVFILRYLYRFDNTATERRPWQIWTSYAVIGDGTGAESPAVQEFAEIPTAEQIAGFKAKLVSKSVQ